MLTEICQYLHNWFDRNQPKYFGKMEVRDGYIFLNDVALDLVPGQYYRVIGSLFSDGVHKYTGQPAEIELPSETFNGAVWGMAVPPDVIDLAKEIEAWQTKYGGVDSTLMSPFNSESFGGYSYSKSGGGASASAGTGGTQPGTWQSAFESRLNLWRKIP